MSQEFTEEELAALEAEMERITVDDVLIQTTVTLLNLAARKAGLAAPPGEEPSADWDQVRQAIDGARALVPLLEARHAEQLGPVRDTLARLQVIYAQQAGGAAAPAGPRRRARRTGRLERVRRSRAARTGGRRARAALGPPLGARPVGLAAAAAPDASRAAARGQPQRCRRPLYYTAPPMARRP